MKKIILIFLFPLMLSAQDKSERYADLIDSFMTAQASVADFNGNVLVAKSGEVIYEKSFGYRNYDTKELLDANTVFELASVSKQFTATGILLLIDKGKLKFTDTLRAFFPELPYPNITIKDMIIHTSGLPNYMPAMIDKWDHSKIAFNDDLIKFLADQNIPPEFQPGERFEYSNLAYTLLASIIEKVSGQTFTDYMKKNIFDPLGMNSALIYNTRRSSNKVINDYALGYVYSDSLMKFVLPDSTKQYEFVRYLDGITGDGIVNSNARDILKWDRALKNGTLLSEGLQKEMLTPQSVYDSVQKIYYGYGVFLDSNIIGKRIFHGGAWPGYSTNLTRLPDDDITIILLSNNQVFTTTIANTLGYILKGGMFELPYIHKESYSAEFDANKYTGTYLVPSGIKLFPSGIKIELIQKNGTLYDHTSSEDIGLKPESATKFFYGNGSGLQIEFQLDDSGNIEKVFLIVTGAKVEMERV